MYMQCHCHGVDFFRLPGYESHLQSSVATWFGMRLVYRERSSTPVLVNLFFPYFDFVAPLSSKLASQNKPEQSRREVCSQSDDGLFPFLENIMGKGSNVQKAQHASANAMKKKQQQKAGNTGGGASGIGNDNGTSNNESKTNKSGGATTTTKLPSPSKLRQKIRAKMHAISAFSELPPKPPGKAGVVARIVTLWVVLVVLYVQFRTTQQSLQESESASAREGK